MINKLDENIVLSGLEKERGYWLNQLSGEICFTKVEVVPSEMQSKMVYHLPDSLCSKISSLANHSLFGIYTVLLSGLYFVLYQYFTYSDIVIGSPVFKQESGDELLNSVLLLRMQMDGQLTFKEYIQTIQEKLYEANENMNYPYKKVLETIGFDPDEGQHPFNTFIDFKNIHQDINSPLCDLLLEFVWDNGELCCNARYNENYVTGEMLGRLFDSFTCYFHLVLANYNVKLGDLDLLTAAQKHQIINEFNNTKVDYKEKLIVSLFEEQVFKTPNNIAVFSEDATLTYHGLNQKANQLGCLLRKMGVKPDSVVAIMADKSFEIVVGIFGILKAGGAYLPIDPVNPKDRINFMLKDCNINILLTQKKYQNYIDPTVKIIYLDEEIFAQENGANLVPVNTINDLAYIIYTSGSTGTPKGSMVEHKGWLNLLLWFVSTFAITHQDKVFLISSLSFDLTQKNIIAPLIVGASIGLPKSGLFDPTKIREFIKNHHITLLNCAPSAFYAILEYETNDYREIESIRNLFLGGEPISMKFLEKWVCSGNCRTAIWNTYGPTECTDIVSYCQIDPSPKANVLIGKPIWNCKLYILDSQRKIVPIGVPGELCVSGINVGRGYVNRRELNAEKFVENPFEVGARLYRTGDLAKWLPNGNIDFLGRKDYQVKIRGYRVELGEIERRLMKYDGVKEAIVTVNQRTDGDKYLSAYLVVDKKVTTSGIKKYLGAEMPDYMIPIVYMQLEKFPLNINGKIDRKKLPPPENNLSLGMEYTPPANDIESQVYDAWKEVLGLEKIGTGDNFFDIGGNSLQALKVASKLSKNFDVEINDLFEHQTIAFFASCLKAKHTSGNLLDSTKKNILLNFVNQESALHYDLVQNRIGEYRHKNEKYQQIDLTQQKRYKNILLTGATGYLGLHLLNELLKSTDAKLYLLIRGSSVQEAENRLVAKSLFYFAMDITKQDKQRITVVNGDLSKEYLGLSSREYHLLSLEVDCIINSAANVKYFGQYQEFYEINVNGTQQLIEFALAGKQKDFQYISTMGLSAIYRECPELIFTEYETNLEKNTDNYYISTKLEAENRLFHAKEKGLTVNIFRVGNLVLNSKTGKFQENINENAFSRFIRGFVNLGIIPNLKQKAIDFTYVDLTSKAIVLLFNRANLINEVYHIYNPQLISLYELGNYMQQLGIHCKAYTKNDFVDYLFNYAETKEIQDDIINVILYINVLNTQMQSYCWKTELLLKRLGFEWQEINEYHVQKMMECYCKA